MTTKLTYKWPCSVMLAVKQNVQLKYLYRERFLDINDNIKSIKKNILIPTSGNISLAPVMLNLNKFSQIVTDGCLYQTIPGATVNNCVH